jgi:hypothetical protein
MAAASKEITAIRCRFFIFRLLKAFPNISFVSCYKYSPGIRGQ